MAVPATISRPVASRIIPRDRFALKAQRAEIRGHGAVARGAETRVQRAVRVVPGQGKMVLAVVVAAAVELRNAGDHDAAVALDRHAGGAVRAVAETGGHYAVVAEAGVETAVGVVAGQGEAAVAVRRWPGRQGESCRHWAGRQSRGLASLLGNQVVTVPPLPKVVSRLPLAW